MTVNEIIKALDEIAHNENLKQYSGIPDVAACAIDLIERLQDENDRYKEQCSKCGQKTTKTIINLQDLIAEQKAEIERLREQIDNYEREAELAWEREVMRHD